MVKFITTIVITFAALAAAAPTNNYPKYGTAGDFEAVNNEKVKRTNNYPKYGTAGDFEAVNDEKVKRTNNYPKYGTAGDFEAVNEN